MPATITAPSTELTDAAIWAVPFYYYHAYYMAGLREALSGQAVGLWVNGLQRFSHALRLLRRVRPAHSLTALMVGRLGGWVDRMVGWLGGHRMTPSGQFHLLVGQYEFALRSGRIFRLAIDAADGGEVASVDIAAASDLYFKTKYRSDLTYLPNVLPGCNGNPLILPHIETLRQYREYFGLGVVTSPECPLAADHTYGEIPERIEAFVHDRERIDRVAAAAAEYFDVHASPHAVGGKILAQVLNTVGAAQ